LLLEIWSRGQPWDEIGDDDCQFSLTLTDKVVAGERPALPDHSTSPAPAGYRELMEECWSGDPAARPTFAAIVDVLDKVQHRAAQVVYVEAPICTYD
jgi:hypothetical protein